MLCGNSCFSTLDFNFDLELYMFEVANKANESRENNLTPSPKTCLGCCQDVSYTDVDPDLAAELIGSKGHFQWVPIKFLKGLSSPAESCWSQDVTVQALEFRGLI